MDITYNKVDQTALPISQDRVSASEYNQIAASLMHIINTAGLTPDSQDNAQLLNALGPRIVETYSNGTSWYRIYSDGWCEQGGYLGDTPFNTTKTISLPVPYNDTDFTILTSVKNSSGAHNFRWTKDSSSSITFNRVGDSNCTGHWMTLGYTNISS